MTEVPIDAHDSQTRKYNVLGGGLITLAFVGPVLAAAFGIGTAATAGEQIGRNIGALLFLALVTWLATRAGSALSKAKARTVAGVILCVMAVWSSATGFLEQAQAKRIMKEGLALQARNLAKSEELDQRFNALTVDQYMTPSALASPASVDAGLATVQRYRALLAERKAFQEAIIADQEAFIASIPPGVMKRAAERSAASDVKESRELYALLDRTQSAHADAITEVLAWAKRNAGQLHVRGNQFVFTSQSQQASLLALATKLQDAEKEVEASSKKALTQIAAANAKREANLKRAKALLED
jgi:hypothetical protein